MSLARILVFAGSVRANSFNGRLAALAAKELTRLDADVTLISLADYPIPLYDANAEAASGPPENAVKLKRLFGLQHGIFIASPEYNASITPLLKNALDWISRVREGREPPLAAYRNRVFALGAASNGTYGGMRSLIALRHVLELGCGALVIPEQIAVREAAAAFDEMDNLKDERNIRVLAATTQRLVDAAQRFASV
jgi:NAD(P)H-dependent FMN reductase